jgi:Uma2 family endonuclease
LERYAERMRALVLDPQTTGFEELLVRRRRAGLDRLDEVWDGVLHMVPAPSSEHARVTQQVAVALDRPAHTAGLIPAMGEFNLGESEQDFRVPDGGVLRPGADGTWLPTAALVVEIVSLGDETWDKLPFYAAHGVDEVLIVDPTKRSIDWLALDGGEYRPVERSELIDLGPRELAERIEWPQAG